MPATQLKDTISTLVVNDFHVEEVQRFPDDNSIINVYKLDKLGGQIRYSILFANTNAQLTMVDNLQTLADNYKASPIIVSDQLKIPQYRSYNYEDFFDLFGGVMNTGLILIDDLPTILSELGHNRVPNGLNGKAEDLHEIYVKECLQYILESPTRRYGKDRLFEHLPDGLVLGKGRLNLLYDSKAYSSGYAVSADDIKRFSSYANNFNRRYESVFGKVFSFLVISGTINDSEKSLSNRSDELYSQCGTKLSSISSVELGQIVKMLKHNATVKRSILWDSIFTKTIVNHGLVQKEVTRILKDKIV